MRKIRSKINTHLVEEVQQEETNVRIISLVTGHDVGGLL